MVAAENTDQGDCEAHLVEKMTTGKALVCETDD
jgi:hypothetical protein